MRRLIKKKTWRFILLTCSLIFMAVAFLYSGEETLLYFVQISSLINSTASSKTSATTDAYISTVDTQDGQFDNSSLEIDIRKLLSPENTTDKVKTCSRRSEHLWSKNYSLLLNQSFLFCHQLLSSAENGTQEDQDLFSNASLWQLPEPHDASSVLEVVRNCSQFLRDVDFSTEPASEEEKAYPLAYVFVAHRNAAQTVRLFRMIYQSQNAYCLTYDTKSDENYKKIITSLASCFPKNVFLNPNPEPIYYFGYSILRSVMSCMRVLAASSISWRYVQVVSWNDFPLRTNLELVRIFKILNGSQDCELLSMNTPDYITYKDGHRGGERRSVPPHGLTVYKGSFATTMSREFIDFMFDNSISQVLYNWLNDSKCAEEFYWPTLIHNIQLNPPGGFPGQCEIYYTNAGEKKPFLSRFQVWDSDKGDRQCKGKSVNLSCVYGIKDLAMLLKRFDLIAHKVYEEFEPALMYCMEEWYWQRVCDKDRKLNLTYYENLPSVRYHRLSKDEKKKFVCTI